MQCVVYARVSTDRQADRELSIPAQLSAMRQYASDRGWRVVEEFVEPGVSARTADRPELKRLLARCRESRPRIDVVLVHKIDRLARNLADHVAIRGMLSKSSVRLASVSENLEDSVSGQLVEHIMASIAEFYSANLGEEVKKGMRQKVEQGGWPHLPPRGYRVRRDHAGRSQIEVDPVLGPAVRRAFELAALGIHQTSDLYVQFARLGLVGRHGRMIGKDGVHRLLRNPFYKGVVRWNGQERPGIHAPLVSEELWDRVQARLGRRVYQRRPGHLLTGFAQCQCGGVMMSETHRRWSYYRCRNNLKRIDRCRAPYCNVAVVNASVYELYARTPLTAERRHQVRGALEQLRLASRVAAEDQAAAIRERLGVLGAQMVRLADALAEGLMDSEVLRLSLERIETEKRQLNIETDGR